MRFKKSVDSDHPNEGDGEDRVSRGKSSNKSKAGKKEKNSIKDENRLEGGVDWVSGMTRKWGMGLETLGEKKRNNTQINRAQKAAEGAGRGEKGVTQLLNGNKKDAREKRLNEFLEERVRKKEI